MQLGLSPGFAVARSAPIFVKAHLTALAGATASICQLGMHISGTAEATQAHLLALTPFEEHADPNSRAAAHTGLQSGRTPTQTQRPCPAACPPPLILIDCGGRGRNTRLGSDVQVL